MKSKRSTFDLSHRRKFSCDMGYLNPCYVEEVLPGDSFKVHSDMLVRLTPLLAPVMHEVDVFTHFWFVPNRLIWNEWEQFITGGTDGKSAPSAPYFNTFIYPDRNDFHPGSLGDYLGLPYIRSFSNGLKVSALYHRAYNLIWNEWYRDQNLQEPSPISFGSGQDTITNRHMLRRNWKKDYFTASLPWPQRGSAVSLNLSGNAPVSGSVEGDVGFHHSDNPSAVYGSLSIDADHYIRDNNHRSGALGLSFLNGYFRGEADLSHISSVTVNKLREAFSIQRFMENSARGGARYIEAIKSHFGVDSSDSRLQRPEYLGGGRSPIVISEVLQTSSTDSTSPQGNMAGHGYSLQRSHSFKRYFEEHGIILGLLSIMPKAAYQQGIDRRFTRFSKFDYFWPELAHLGEQEVKTKEIYFETDDPEKGFGYQPRYQEYRYRQDTVHSDFKYDLNFWHMARIFDNEPKLNADFVACNPTKRVSVITNRQNVFIDMLHKVSARRLVPKYGTPSGLF